MFKPHSKYLSESDCTQGRQKHPHPPFSLFVERNARGHCFGTLQLLTIHLFTEENPLFSRSTIIIIVSAMNTHYKVIITASYIVNPNAGESEMASNNFVCLPLWEWHSQECLMSLQSISTAERPFEKIETTYFFLWSPSAVHACQKCSALLWQTVMSQLCRSKATDKSKILFYKLLPHLKLTDKRWIKKQFCERNAMLEWHN